MKLYTQRLLLRPFTLADAKRVQFLAGDSRIASSTRTIPHPYENGMAEAWIQTHEKGWILNSNIIYAVCLRSENLLIGCVGLEMDQTNRQAELGYWIGHRYWNNGYCTESVRRLLSYAFEEQGLQRVYGYHLTRNPASGRVMRKVGMQKEGGLYQRTDEQERQEGYSLYAILPGNRD